MSTLTDQDFERILAESREFSYANSDLSAGTTHLQSLLPDKNDSEAYHQWLMARKRAKRAAASPLVDVPTSDVYRRMIMDTNFLDINAVATLNEIMNRGVYPHISVGHQQSVAYRLLPNTTLLAPTKDTNWNDEHHIFPSMLLGINTNALVDNSTPEKPLRSRKNNATDDSTKSGDSDSTNDETGFVFYQLGAVQYTHDLADPTTTDSVLANSKAWFDSGYVMVVKIGTAGKAEGVYILFNYRPEDEHRDRQLVDEGTGGYLPTGEYLAGGCIAENFGELGADYAVHVIADMNMHSIQEDYELVTCIRLEYPPRIVRQFVVPV